MRIVFCDNVLVDRARPDSPFDLQPHVGLLSLLAVTREHGHSGVLVDPSLALHDRRLRLDDTFYRTLARMLLDQEPDVLGFTTLGCNLICTYQVASHVKAARPSLPVLLGGPHATILHREILQTFDVFDVVVRGEAEATLPLLLERDCREELFSVPALSYRDHSGVVSSAAGSLLQDLDELPWPAYDLHPIRELGLTSLRVEAGRGCPFNCTFCSTASFFGRRYRLKSAARLVGELDLLHQAYGIAHFDLTHDMFTANKHKVSEFCAAVAPRGYTWSCSARMDCVDPDLLATMHGAGCRSIYYGVETGSARMQKITRKHLDLALVEPILEVTGALGIESVVSTITGYPEETEKDQDATLDLLGTCLSRAEELISLQLHLLTPEPGTDLHAEYGDRLAYDGHISDFNFPTLGTDDGRLMSAHPQLFMNHHYYPTVLPRTQHVFVDQSFPLLLSLGHPLLRRMARDFAGRLSLLIRSLRRFAECGRVAAVDARLLTAFAEDVWGPSSPITAAIRFLLAGGDLRSRVYHDQAVAAGGAGVAAVAGVAAAHRLSPGAALLCDVPHVPALLAALSDDPAALDGDVDPKYTFLLLVQPRQPDRVRSFEVDGVARDLLEWLCAARSADDLAGWLDRHDDQVGSLRAFFGHLQTLGVVRTSSSGQQQPSYQGSPA